MGILAIDPGTTQSAFVIWDASQREIIDKGILLNNIMLSGIHQFPYHALVIEMVQSFGMPVGKEVFETCVWVGRFWQASHYPVHLLYRKDVKSFLCGSMKAKDSNIRAALIDMLGKEVTKGVSKDVWSALALAVTFTDTCHDEEKK